MPVLNSFRVDCRKDGTPFIEIKDDEGRGFSADLTQEMLVKVARATPQYINVLIKQKVLGLGSDPDVQIHVDAVEAEGGVVNVDMIGQFVMLSLVGPHGLEMKWNLTPALAKSLGDALQKKAENIDLPQLAC